MCHLITIDLIIFLSGLNYAVFGLGNKTYEHYNAMGIYVDKRLEELGGKRIHDLGIALMATKNMLFLSCHS